MITFSVTYEIVTDASSMNGEAEELGWISVDMPLREAVATLFETRTSQVDGVLAVEANEYPITSGAQWISVYNGPEFLTGAQESRALHIPDSVSGATRLRIARLLGCRGVQHDPA